MKRYVVIPPTKKKPASKKSISQNRWARAQITSPERKHLTKLEWQERGDIIRCLKIEGIEYSNADCICLADLRDAYYSIARCQIMRLAA